MQKSKRDKSKNSNPLMRHFNYDAHDLQDNKRGFISHRQKTSMKWYLFRNTLWIMAGGFIAGLWVVVFLALLPYAWTDADAGIGMKIFTTAGFLFAAAMSILAIIALIEVWRNVLHDVRIGKAEQIGGTITKYSHKRHKEGTSYWIVIQNTRFDIGYEQYKAIDNNKPYHLYLAEKTRRILALETAPMSYQDKVKPAEKAKRHA